MRMLAIVGKVDSRIIAYPIARALSLHGQTALISDDGAYRRLFFGDDMIGEVSGVDVSVGLKMDDELEQSLKDSGIKYDNVVIVSSGYIPNGVDGVIVCSGVNDTMGAEIEDSKEVKDEKGTEKKEENEVDKGLEKKEDKIDIPKGVASDFVYISFDRAPKDGELAIQLKDQAIRYIYKCEERKELQVLEDKGINKIISKLCSSTLGIKEEEMISLLNRKEYIKGK